MNKRSPNNLNFIIDDVPGQILVQRMDLEGYAISTTSACSASSYKPSHVLVALGLSGQDARSSIRVSLSKWTTKKELDNFVKTLVKLVKELRKKKT